MSDALVESSLDEVRWDLTQLFASHADWWDEYAAITEAFPLISESPTVDPEPLRSICARSERLQMYAACLDDLGLPDDDIQQAAQRTGELTGNLLRAGANPTDADPRPMFESLERQLFSAHLTVQQGVSKPHRGACTATLLACAWRTLDARAYALGERDPIAAAEMRHGLPSGSVGSVVREARRNLGVFHAFLEEVAHDVGKTEITRADLTAVTRRGSWTAAEALEVVSAGVRPLGPRYQVLVNRVVAERRLHLVEEPSSAQWAHTSSGIGAPSFVLMPFAGTDADCALLAHELGHAVHWDLCVDLPPNAAPVRVAGETFAITNELLVAGVLAQRGAGQLSLLARTAQMFFRQAIFVEFEIEARAAMQVRAVTEESLDQIMESIVSDYYAPWVSDWRDFIGDWRNVKHLFWDFETAVYPVATKGAVQIISALSAGEGALLHALRSGGTEPYSSLLALATGQGSAATESMPITEVIDLFLETTDTGTVLNEVV